MSSFKKLLNMESSSMSSAEALEAPANNLCINILANIGSDESNFEGAFSLVLELTGTLDPGELLVSGFEIMGEESTGNGAFKGIFKVALIPVRFRFPVASTGVSGMFPLEAIDK
jgi:hypothetical protein